MGQRVLFVNHGQRQCGVQEFGVEIAGQLASSTRFDVIYTECDSFDEYVTALFDLEPVAAVLNYHPSTMPWARAALLVRSDIAAIGIIHDVTNASADAWDGPLFDIMITHDPDLNTNNPRFRSGPRPMPRYRPPAAPPLAGPVRIGSFGFAGHDKGFDDIVRLAQESFDDCVISLHIPPGDFVDTDGTAAHDIVRQCQALVQKPGVSVEGSHGFLSREALIDALATNHMNAFLYDPDRGFGGISSSTDIALCAGRPVALRRGKMFRHFERIEPSIFVDDLSFRQILDNGFGPLEPFLQAWSPAALVAAHERAIIDALTVPRRDRVLHAAKVIMHAVASPTFWTFHGTTFPKLLKGNNPALATLTGRVIGEHIALDCAEEGFALFGPYIALPEGIFTARIRFAEGNPMVGRASFDIYAKEVITSRVVEVFHADQSSREIELDFTLTSPRPNVEVRIINERGFTGRIESLEIARH